MEAVNCWPPREILWCGEGDLNSLSPLKTRKLYTTRSSQNTRSARSPPPSHTTSHTALKRPGKWVAWSPCCALSKEGAKKRGRSSRGPIGSDQSGRRVTCGRLYVCDQCA